MHVALGRPYIGRQVTKGDVVYVGAEDARGLALRRKAWLRHNNLTVADVEQHFKAFTHCPNFSIPDAPDAKELVEYIKFLQPETKLIAIDTATAISRGLGLNPPYDGIIMANCNYVASETGATVVLVSHSNKGQSKTFTGGGVFSRDAENVWCVTHRPGSSHCYLEVATKTKTVGKVGDRFQFDLDYFHLDDVLDHGKPFRSSVIAGRHPAKPLKTKEETVDEEAKAKAEAEKIEVVEVAALSPDDRVRKALADNPDAKGRELARISGVSQTSIRRILERLKPAA
jgi:hypothetical protein